MTGKNPFYELEVASRWLVNTAMRKPWAISIEITHNCTANCEHYDKREVIPDEKQAGAKEYRKITERLRANTEKPFRELVKDIGSARGKK